jgi:hypothetical protein
VAGSRVRTAPDSQALLTFFNGTTIKLEPGTDLVVKQVEGGAENQPTAIILKQWLGKTWSRVTKLADPGSSYEIQTPSGIAFVRGTFFTTDVDETGAMRVQTFEGLVGVSAQGEEVYLPAGQQATVQPGQPPSKPMPVSQSDSANEIEVSGNQTEEAASDNTKVSSTTGQNPGNQEAQNLPGEDSPAHWRITLSQLGLDTNMWVFALLAGVVLLSIGLAIIMLRRH